MRLSAFNTYIGGFPQAESTLVYNTFTGAFVELEDRVLAILQKADRGEALRSDELAVVDPEYFDENVGILVESREAEELAYRLWYEDIRWGQGVLSVIVSTTFACNLDCTYCCQADVLDGRTMKPQTALDTARWIAARARETRPRAIKLAFVGGEPLLHPERVEGIIKEVAALVDVPVKFGLITNGVFLTPELVDKWLPLGLTDAKVTLDGDETTHSITRRSKKRGEDSFETIFANVVAASRKIKVTVNGNYTDDTLHGFAPLIRRLREAGLAPGSTMSFTPALQALGAPAESAAACHWSGSRPEMMFALADEVLRNGFSPTDIGSIGPCGFHQRNLFAVDPEGHIYKCPGFLGKTNWSIGHVTTGLNDFHHTLVENDAQKACGTCRDRPRCGGGCVATEYLKKGAPEGVNCERGFFEQHKEDLILRKYALAVTETVEEALSHFPEPRAELPITPKQRPTALRVLAA